MERGGRGKDGKDKETFGCPYPGCGQVSLPFVWLPSPPLFLPKGDAVRVL